MPDKREPKVKDRRPVGRPPAVARDGEKVKDYPQLSIRVPLEFKARLNALSAVTGLAQWRVIVQAINCFNDDLSEREGANPGGGTQRAPHAGRFDCSRSAFRPKYRCQHLSDGDAW